MSVPILSLLAPLPIVRMACFEEAVDHRQSVALRVGQAATDETAFAVVRGRLAIFDHIAVDRGLLDHVGEILLVHVGHPAVGMARGEIGTKQSILFFGRPRLARGRNQRSEEHTSELQSLMRISYAAFCLKNTNKDTQ